MSQLTQSQVAELKGALAKRMQVLRQDIRRVLLQSDNERYREVAGSVGDVADESVADLVADLDAAAIDRDVRELRELEAARDRLKAGTYGVCVDCGDAIAWKRLLAEPGAVRCIRCAAHYEQTHAQEDRPRL
jgi:RNA polymerase-binding transcription factor DksA